MIRRTLFIAIGLLIATSAHAKPSVSTPPIPNNLGSSIALCQAVNTGTKAAMVLIEIVDLNDSGAVLATAGPFNVAPSGQIGVTLTTPPPPFFDKYCRVTGLSKSKVTILFAEFDSTPKPILSVTAP